MIYRLIADAAMTAHFGFLVFLVVGGFLAWRWRWLIWPHLAAAAWGGGTVVFGFPCPLTDLENWGRSMAGGQTLTSSGFIDHYLTGVVYPAEHLELIQAGVAVIVLASWIGLAARVTRAPKP
ncbi:hypothetical protein BJY21_001136 [Kineosphaera limosa]|uniref:DUF2784 domain-containing protein n=1 Tax=Kineosphaera limosa NBRC 100340 TaxID=1184609 RepID=K6WBQ2_9MICO|nr:DUF2784 domain-containing protein [Kineosphaera limosa]NYD99951.1 hypothetical protein [Kineosphaera limosa]GAB96665.1 hypothetical protein KILIM_044_00540 [Kineosphaera limosa NBRC 100340]